MALKKCPECHKDMADSFRCCPFCGFNFNNKSSNDFVPVESPLKSVRPPDSQIFKAILSLISGGLFVFLGIITFLIGFGVVLLGVGVFFTWAGITLLRSNMAGDCPYCGTFIYPPRKKTSCFCPVCQNTMTVTPTHLIPTNPVEVSRPKVTLETSFSVTESKSSKYHQRWDENYDKNLGYEWFKICVEVKDYPFETWLERRLQMLRENSGLTQKDAASLIGIPTSTLSSYENGHTVPSETVYQSMARTYGVPADYLQKGYTLPLDEQIRCARICDEWYIDSLCVSLRSASKMFPDLLTEEDRELCRHLNDRLGLNLDLFGEKAKTKEKAKQEAQAEKERLSSEIRQALLIALKDGGVLQSDFVKQNIDNENLARKIIDGLVVAGEIKKEKKGSSYMLTLSEPQTEKDNDEK